jgi:multidrug transporter EmrE-like cation transporter
MAGCSTLAIYGIVLNTARWDFSKLLGVYVGVLAVVAVLVGKYFFGERVPASTWIGLGVIVLGGLIIQLGSEAK